MITLQWHICDVCRLVDYNVEKKMCGYCPMCDAWICEDDANKWGRRLKAALKRKLEPEYKGLQDYEKHIDVGKEREK